MYSETSLSKTKKGISVIICCFNSVQRLPETLKHLANQKVNDWLSWEIVLVNNNSSDNTSELARTLWNNLESPISLSIVHEPKPGLSHARERGMREANFDVLVWCDDDNWLSEKYVQTAYEIMENDKGIGALGGWCEAAFNNDKPKWFDQQAHFFAVSKQGRSSGNITEKKGCLYGAGMVLRKSHWQQLKRQGFRHLLSDRVGKKLNSGGDTEYTYALRLLGYKIWFDERLYFKHFMDDERLNLNYLSKLRKARTQSNLILWPYLDLLKGKPSTKTDRLAYAFKGGFYRFIRQSGAICIGNYEQKQLAIRYFMFLYYCLFCHRDYEKNYFKTKSWRDKKSV